MADPLARPQVFPSYAVPFVGRQRELDLLTARLDAASTGYGGILLVSGEPGIGKTRLLAELAVRARDQGCVVLTGHAYEMEGLPPYLPFVEALRDYVRTCSPESLRTQLGAGASQLALLVPELRERLLDLPQTTPSAGEYARFALFEAVVDLLCTVARAAPSGLLLVLEDLHWADAASLLLLQHIARRIGSEPVLLAATYRSAERDRTPALRDALAALAREDGVERLRLGALPREAAARFIAAVGGTEPAVTVVEALHRDSEGNPFFLGELVRHLRIEGRDLADPMATTVQWGIPESVRDVIGRQFARLSTETHRLLQAAAVLGDGFGADEVGVMSGAQQTIIADGLDEALAAGVLREDADRYRFSHALIRQTLYADLRLPRRQQLHQHAANALVQVHATNLESYLSAIAGHYRLAGTTAERATVLEYASRAGMAAARVFAWEEALTHWQAAIELTEALVSDDAGPRRHVELLLAAGEAAYCLGDGTRSRELYWAAADRARQLDSVEDLALAALGFCEYTLAPGVEQKQLALLEEACIALSTAGNVSLRARVLGLLGGEYVWSFDPLRSEALTREALAVARRLDDPATLAYVLNERLWALIFSGTGRLPERLTLGTELLTLANQLGDANLMLKGHRGRLLALLEAGDMLAVDEELAAVAPKAEASRQAMWLRMLTVWRIMRALVAGRFDAVAACIAEQRSLMARWSAESEGPEELSDRYVMIQLQRLRGEHAAAVALLSDLATGYKTWSLSALARWFVEAQLALLCAEQGRLVEARAWFDRLMTGNLAELRHGGGVAAALATLAEACALLGDAKRAAVLYPLLSPYAGGTIVFRWGYACLGAAEYYLGLLAATQGQLDRSAQHFEAALGLNERMGARPYVARTQTAYAALLVENGRAAGRGRALELLASAVQTYTELDMDWWAERARGQVAAMPSAAASARPAHPDGLSEREVEVLRLVAAGKSNPEIAAALVISRYTVDRHVNHILAKTRTANRVEAAAYAHRHGLATP